jgi:hypothetical protein
MTVTPTTPTRPDPLGLPRCASCYNAFETERRPDGKCGHCGGDFDLSYAVAVNGGPLRPAYALVRDGQEAPLELWPRDEDGGGAITAIDRAAHFSLSGEPVEVMLPNGRLLARFVGGAREGRTRPLRAPVKAVD